MNSEFKIKKSQLIKVSSLTLFFALSFIISSSYLIQDNLNQKCSIEKTAEQEENESEKENEKEKEFDDDEFDEYTLIKKHSRNSIFAFFKSEFSYLNTNPLHFGDTYTPPPDII
jgi:hypothetical protein